jgi:hypothetical protein
MRPPRPRARQILLTSDVESRCRMPETAKPAPRSVTTCSRLVPSSGEKHLPAPRGSRRCGGPRGARTHNPRIKRPQDHGNCGLYLRLRSHCVPHQPHQPTTVDVISCHEPCHAASDRCGWSLLDGFAPAGERGRLNVERVATKCVSARQRSRCPRSPARGSGYPDGCAPPRRRLARGRQPGRALRLADVPGAFGVGHLKRVSRSDRLTTVADETLRRSHPPNRPDRERIRRGGK